MELLTKVKNVLMKCKKDGNECVMSCGARIEIGQTNFLPTESTHLICDVPLRSDIIEEYLLSH